MARPKSKRPKRETAAQRSERIVAQVNEPYSKELPPPKRMPSIADGIEMGRLGAELKELCPAKYDEVIVAMRKIVDAQRMLKGLDRPADVLWEIEDSLDGERVNN